MNFARFIFTALAAVAFASPAAACGGAEDACVIESGTYHLLQPPAPEAAKGIVMHLHGGGGKGAGMLKTGLAREAAARGYVFVAPNGYHPGARFPHNWAVRAKNFGHEKDDIALLRAVADDVAARFGVDRERVLLAGFSRGGSMAWDVACFDPTLARAYAPAAGAFWDDLPERCEGPVDLFHTHGWRDRTVPLEGRPLWDGAVAQGDVWESLAILRRANGCDGRQPSRSVTEGEFWWRHWETCASGLIDLLLHPGGHGAPTGWAGIVMDWFEERLSGG